MTRKKLLLFDILLTHQDHPDYAPRPQIFGPDLKNGVSQDHSPFVGMVLVGRENIKHV